MLARSAWKSTVAVRPCAGNARLKWPKTLLPALENLGELRRAATSGAVDRARILLDDSASTALEHADGNLGPPYGGSAVSHHASAGATVAALAAAFDKHLAPECRQPRTRAGYWRARRLVVTWAVARQAVHDILRMPLDTLKALTWDMVCFAVLSSQIKLVWKSWPGAAPAVSAPPAAL